MNIMKITSIQRFPRGLALTVVAALLLGGCISNPINTSRIDKPQQVQQAKQQIAEDQLLDLWVEMFDPGELPEDEDEARGLSLDIRKAEARYMPIHLARTIEKSGYWGAVRVVPKRTEGFEVLVRGRIEQSDGEQLKLSITALDARGEEWFKRDYEHNIEAKEYAARGKAEVFQPLYNQIANDLIEHRNERTAKEIKRIRQIAELRFAQDMAPKAFTGYLKVNDGHYSLQRLPAQSDPMVKRIRAIRDRDYLLVDTLNGHFDNYYRDMGVPYKDWRQTRADETERLRKVEQAATTRKVLGGLAVLGGIVLTASGADDNASSRALKGSLGQVMVIGGALAVKSGFDKDSETSIHKAALEELGESFGSEAKPLVVQVEGETHRLTGSAENQYAQWRALLKRLYAKETGLPSKGD